MSQLSLDIAPPRRIDVTIERLEKWSDGLPSEEKAKLAGSWWNIVSIVVRLRAMERAEESVSTTVTATMADAYDRIVQPGEHVIEALLSTFREVYDRRREWDEVPSVT